MRSFGRFACVPLLALIFCTSVQADQLYAPNSVWNKALDTNAPLEPDPNGANIEAQLLNAAQTHTDWIDTDSYSTPIYVVPAGQPYVPVTLNSWRSGTSMGTWLSQTNGIPIPPGAKQAAGSDGHITVWQPSTDKVWSCWATTHPPSGWQAQTCQGSNHVSTSSGYATEWQWPPWSDHTWTSTATGLPVEAGTVTVDQWEAGSVGHALALDLPNVCGSYYSWPAQQHDGGSPNGSCVPEGAHFRLPASYTCTSLTNSAAVTLCKAAKNRGLIVRDSAPGVGLYAEDTTAEGNGDPYYGPPNIFDDEYPSAFLAPSRFPWSQMQLLKLSVCTDPSQSCTP